MITASDRKVVGRVTATERGRVVGFIESGGMMRGADQRDALVPELQRLSMGELRAMVESAVRNQR